MNPKILVVDDNDSLRLLLSFTLKAEGYEVETASDGVEAFDKFKLGEPDVLVTDLVMPRMDGQTLCLRVREISLVPILVITGDRGENNDIDTVSRLGANGYMIKPFDLDAFVLQVKNLLTN
jgi:DNA-binding response OmpR family regulator